MTSYVTPAVEKFVNEIRQKTQQVQPAWAATFQKTFLNTLSTTLSLDDDDKMFVLTGDIPAMWQRDSTAQLRPYLILAQRDSNVATIIEQVVKRQFFNMNLDPYANAFNETANGHGHQTDQTEMSDWIWERKFEIDSLCYPVQLAYLLYRNTGRTTQFDKEFVSGIKKLLLTFQTEQHHATSTYRFIRTVDRPEDTLVNNGLGRPVADTGMIWSGFRPSDDACHYGYLIPANMFAVVILGYLQEIFTKVIPNHDLSEQAMKIKQAVQMGLQKYGFTTNAAGEKVFAYEVDGLGNKLLMDDGNVPSLLSAPYLGYCSIDDPIYLATRRTLLSPENPYYYQGSYGSGQGSPHTPEHYIWPIAIAMAGLTQPDGEIRVRLLNQLVATTAGTQLMHESFNVENPAEYTREWFSWANMMFCELLLIHLGYRIER